MKTKELRDKHATTLAEMLKDAGTVVEDAEKELHQLEIKASAADEAVKDHEGVVKNTIRRFFDIGKLIRKLASQDKPDVQEVSGVVDTLSDYVNHQNAIPEAKEKARLANADCATARAELERAKRIYAALEELSKATF